MKSYSETNVFDANEVKLFKRATELVSKLLDRQLTVVRCHELARAVGRVLKLEVQDGYYGFCDHSWLWTVAPPKDRNALVGRLGLPNILDVYAVGQLPMVRLVDCAHTQLPHVGWAYRPGEARKDINHERVDSLAREMSSMNRLLDSAKSTSETSTAETCVTTFRCVCGTDLPEPSKDRRDVLAACWKCGRTYRSEVAQDGVKWIADEQPPGEEGQHAT